jgi:hypothetical protein
MIRIDVHPAGENPTNMTHTLPTPVHVRPVHASCERSSYVATFHKPPTTLEGPYCSWEKGLSTQPQPSWVIHRSATQFLSQHIHWSSNESQISVDSRLLSLPGPYHWHAINVQYLLTGTNPSVLNRHKRGLPHRKPRNNHNTLTALSFWGFH